MLRQFLMIGLGGSGGKTLRYTKQSLEEWLIGIGWDEGIPSGWQFLHIDTPESQDSPILPGRPDLLPPQEYFSMYRKGIGFNVVAESLKTRGTNFDGWWVDPIRMRVPIQSGAGQYRSVGRVVALDRLPDISNVLGRQIARMNQGTSIAQLRRLEKASLGSNSSEDSSPLVFIISSLAGGTGAGLVTDVADELRSFGDGWLDNSFAVLYAADVFQYLSDSATAGIQPNAAAAIAELAHGNFGGGGFSAPGGAKLANISGPKYPFLVGHKNASGVVFGDQIDVYRVIGRGLAAVMTEPSLQDELASYTEANWQSNAKKFPADGGAQHMLLDSHYHGVFQGLGYAELELGVERFSMYASRRIARDAIDWMLDAHHSIAAGQQRFEDATPDQVIETLAEDALGRFLGSTELNERGPEANDIIDGINPEAEGRRIFQATLANVQSEVEAIDWKKAGTSEWVDLVIRETELRYGRAVEEYDQHLRASAAVWSEGLFDRVQEAVESQIAQQGLSVTEQLIRRVVEELREASKELQAERHEWAVLADHLRSNVNAVLDHLGGGSLTKDAPEIEEACEVAVRTALYYRMEEKRRLVGAALINDIIPNVLDPMSTAVRDARQRLVIEIEPGGAMARPIDYWPRHEPSSDRGVPDALRPGGSVAPVIDPEGYPELFDRLLEKSLGDAADTQDHRYRLAREDAIRGRFIEEQPSVIEDHRLLPPAVKVLDEWVPDEKLMVGGRPQQPARFVLNIDRDAILNRALAWTHRDGFAFEKFIRQGLRDYLSERPGVSARELNDRQEAFMAALEKAFRSSAPLVDIDDAAVEMIHVGKQTALSPTPSEIPLAGHPLEDRVRAFTHNAMLEGQEPTLSRSPRVTRISVFSTLDGALHPAAFDSITAPIADAWREALRTNNLENFWRWRRARPLADAVPIPRDTLRALIRGWLTANALTLLEFDADRAIVKLQTPTGVVESPPLLVSPGPNMYEVLGALVETLSVALPTAANSKRFDEYLGIYEHLIRMGTSAQAGRAPSEYLSVNRVIADWTDAGRPWKGYPEVRPDLAERSERVDHLLKLYTTAADQYRKLAADAHDRGHITPTFAWLGLVPIVEGALADLSEAIDRMNIAEVGV